jgi:hypothetical protein
VQERKNNPKRAVQSSGRRKALKGKAQERRQVKETARDVWGRRRRVGQETQGALPLEGKATLKTPAPNEGAKKGAHVS